MLKRKRIGIEYRQRKAIRIGDIPNETENTSFEEPDTIPPDIINEILSFLPAKSLLRFKCVCRKWESVIQDDEFIGQHILRGGSAAYTKIEGINDNSFKLISSILGLVLERKNASNKYRIRNPTIRHVFDLPDPPDIKNVLQFEYVTSTGHFKVISISDTDNGTTVCSIFTLGIDETSWRPLNIPYGQCVNRARDGSQLLDAEDALHYVREGTRASESFEIITLNLADEGFTFNTLPRSSFAAMSKVWVFMCNDRVAFANISNDKIDMMVLEDYKEKQWSTKIEFPLTFLKKDPDALRELTAVFGEDQVLRFWTKGGKEVLEYSLQEEKIIQTISLSEGREIPLYQKTLVYFKGMRLEVN